MERHVIDKNYSDVSWQISRNLNAQRHSRHYAGVSALAEADNETKELIALALGVNARCDGCIGFRAEALVRLGATRKEVEEAPGMAVYRAAVRH